MLPTITHIHMSVIPLLAASGTIFLDARAHKTIYDGCQVATRARRRGAPLPLRGPRPPRRAAARRARPHPPGLHGRREQHDRQRAGPARVRRGRPRARRAALRRRRARLRRDRRARRRTSRARTACAATAIVRHAGESYDNIVLVGGFSKAYSSLLAFIACPTEVKDLLKVAAPPYLYSGPSPVASLATVLAGFDVNEQRGDALRATLYRPHRRACSTALRPLGIETPEPLRLPDHRDPARRPHAHRRGRPLPVRARRLRDAGRLPAGPEGRGRLPHPAHRGRTPTRRSTR